VLSSYAGGTIEIEGHTDNVPIHTSQFANNDELSDARALAVFYYIIDVTDLDPANIKHSGRGEYQPVADNTTAEGRAKNRRVEIRIYNPLSAQY
jgi:chemotaxis protein MotB